MSQSAAGSKYSSKSAIQTSLDNDSDVANFPHLPIKYNTKLLPSYSTALMRSVDDSVPVDELDNLQLELEKLLSKAALRHRVLKSEYESLDKDEKRQERRSKALEKQPHSPSNKRKETGHRKLKPPKHGRHKSSPGYTSTSQALSAVDGSDVQSYNTAPQSKELKVIVPKNDTPNKFWLSVEPYCMPVTNEDLKLLDDILEPYNTSLVPQIPELGVHYSQVWETEDLKDIKGKSSGGLKKEDSIGAIQQLRGLDAGITGPLTQRLTAALLEEDPNLDVASLSNCSSENTDHSNYNSFQSLMCMKNGIDIERRLKKELIKQGFLEEDSQQDEADDEIMQELKKLKNELSAVSEHNKTTLQELRNDSAKEVQRLEKRRKLDLIDHEILELHKKTVQAKAKRKPLTLEERQEVLRLTTEQKNLSESLE